MVPELRDQVVSMMALSEPLRRALYLYVAGKRRPVSRAEAAASQGVSRTVAAFHLDRLVDAGLLQVSRGRTSGRRGPGAGRPAVLYARSERQHELNIPPRAYALASHLLADAVERAGADRLLHEVAEFEGERLGRRAVVRAGGAAAGLDAAAAALEHLGYEPERDGGRLWLHNCPFRDVAESNPPVICGMNLALLTGIVRGLAGRDLEARMDPAPGRCCVVISNSKIG